MHELLTLNGERNPKLGDAEQQQTHLSPQLKRKHMSITQVQFPKRRRPFGTLQDIIQKAVGSFARTL